MGMIEQLLTDFDTAIFGYVESVFGNLSPAVFTLWKMMLLLWIIFYGYRTLFSGNFEGQALTHRLLVLVVVMMVGTQWDVFASLVYDLATKFPGEIASHMVSARGHDVENLNRGLTDFFDEGTSVSFSLIKKGSITKTAFWLYGVFAFIATMVFGLYATALILLSKLAVALLLAVGPIYVLFFMFPQTKELAQGWLRTLINYAFIPVLIYGLLSLVGYVIGPRVEALATAEQTNSDLVTPLVFYLLAVGCSFLLALQILSINSSITGGYTLSTLGSMTRATAASAWSARAAYSQRHNVKKGAMLAGYGAIQGAQALSRTLRLNRLGGSK